MSQDKPKLFVMCGMTASGKTTFAKMLSEHRELQYIDPDRFLDRLNGEFFVRMSTYSALYEAEQARLDTILDASNPSFAGRIHLTELFPEFEHHLIVIEADFDLCVKNSATRRVPEISEQEMRRIWSTFQFPEIQEWKYWKSMIWYRNLNNKGFQQMHMIRHV